MCVFIIKLCFVDSFIRNKGFFFILISISFKKKIRKLELCIFLNFFFWKIMKASLPAFPFHYAKIANITIISIFFFPSLLSSSLILCFSQAIILKNIKMMKRVQSFWKHFFHLHSPTVNTRWKFIIAFPFYSFVACLKTPSFLLLSFFLSNFIHFNKNKKRIQNYANCMRNEEKNVGK